MEAVQGGSAGTATATGSSMTVRDVHRSVRTARHQRCPHAPACSPRSGERFRSRQLSHYRAVSRTTAAEPSAAEQQHADRVARRRSEATLVVLIAFVCLIAVDAFGLATGMGQKELLVGTSLVAVAAAVCLNAVTVHALGAPTRNRPATASNDERKRPAG